MGKPKLCKVCNKEFKQQNSLQVVCNYLCALKYNSKKEIHKRLKEYKSNIKKTSDIESVAKKVFQKWVRKRDENLPCISCGKEVATWNGGHFKKAEIYSGVIFNELNVNKQCVYCNLHLNGNEGAYRMGLVEKYGQLAVEGLEELANETRYYKYSKDELKDIINKYKLKINGND